MALFAQHFVKFQFILVRIVVMKNHFIPNKPVPDKTIAQALILISLSIMMNIFGKNRAGYRREREREGDGGAHGRHVAARPTANYNRIIIAH